MQWLAVDTAGPVVGVAVGAGDRRWRFTERLPEIEGVRAQAPLGGEPFPDSPEMRKAAKGN